MPGALMELVATGAQDAYLTANPSITYFKVLYRRHTNFALEFIEQTFNGTVNFGRKVTATVSRNGDLIHKVYLDVDLPAITSSGGNSIRWANNIGHVLVKEVCIDIGGQTIDRQYGDFLTIWNELTQTAEHLEGYNELIGETTALTTALTNGTIPQTKVRVPFQFWFCRNAGLALPLIALQ